MINNKISRIIIATLCVALILCMSILSSCGPTGNEDEVTNNPESSPFPGAEATAQPQSLGQFTVTIPDNGKYLLATENDLVKQAIINKIKQDRGIDLDINVLPLNYNDYFTQITAQVNSGQTIDGIIDDYSMFDTYMSIENLCLPIDDLLTAQGSALLEKIDTNTWSAVTNNNQIMAIPGEGLVENTCLYVRSDITNMMGISEIVTREEFIATLIALSTLPDGIIPLAMNWDQMFDYMAYLHRLPSTDYWKEKSGYKLREQTYFYDDFLNMMKMFYENNYIPEDFFDLTEDEVSTLFTSGIAMMYITEYTRVDEEYEKLLSTVPTAEVSLITNPTSIRMKKPLLSAETNIDQICVYTAYGQNHAALTAYFDWLISDVEHYETAQLGILGTHINFNNYEHEYQYIGQYESNQNAYNALYSLGLTFAANYSQVSPINGNDLDMKIELLKRQSYDHLSTAKVKIENIFQLSAEAQSALYYYRLAMDEATRRYIIGDINYNEFRSYMVNNEENAAIILNELNALDPVE